ncbi:MAG TPA: fibronectin type III domain-containing protein [Verrucomicrobiae bacterium]|nr:fibronectin type III domain-containing protein [Verrucomicrobiae bacterium]
MTLSWDQSPASNPGYKIYYGPASGDYTNSVWVGSATSGTVDNLDSNGTYYFAVTTFDSSGNESAPSSEVAYTFTNGKPAQVQAVPISGFTMTRRGVSFWPNGSNGVQYVIQASSNLVNWISLATNTAPFSFVDGNSSQYKQRFYRAIQAQ